MRLTFVVLLLVAVGGCRPADRYAPLSLSKKKPSPNDDRATPPPAHYAWLEPRPTQDTPLHFVHSSSAEWASLPKYWNAYPHPAAGMRTLHFGLPPLNAAAALVLTRDIDVIKIKVPLGLPDPTPLIPAANPPTLGKWRLGKRIFFDATLLSSGPDRFACATCHQPGRGFSEDWPITRGGKRNTQSLVNVLYNKQQFWDGRADALEQVLVRDLNDERSPTEIRPGKPLAQTSHVWGGLVQKLLVHPDYEWHFKEVFGRQASQDSIAKALATYMRTLLAGNSLVDHAEKQRAQAKDTDLAAKHFAQVLDAATTKALGGARDDIARRLETGHRLFHGKAGCAACHSGPLFTNQDYHHIGIGEPHQADVYPWEAGRFAHVPIGLKETRLQGAYRTPSLRGLPRTGPYFHDGSRRTLREVVQYYNDAVYASEYLDRRLLEAPDRSRALGLSSEEADALTLFLRALEGDAVDIP